MAVNADPLLGVATLGALPRASRPLLVPGEVGAGIVHLGLGAFHRAHQAVYTEDAIVAAGGDWGIVGVAPRSAEIVRRLRDQDNLYSVLTLGAQQAQARVIGALARVHRAADDPDAIVALIADPAIKIMTLTVTEKAYRMDPVSGLLRADPDVLADLGTDRPPTTIPGLLVRGLLARARADAGPIALVCCDNLPENGARVRGVVEQALRLTAAASEDWVSANVTYPSTTVDRIVVR